MKRLTTLSVFIAVILASCTGDPGTKGESGQPGASGPPGPQGSVGEQGLAGEAGPQGPQGDPPSEAELKALIDKLVTERMKDIQGEQGVQGIQGERGEVGPTGSTGAQGIEGPQGSTGIQGQQGPTGPQGETGTKVLLRESQLGNNLSFETASQGQTWLSGLILTIELTEASTVQVIANADVEWSGTFFVGIATSASAPSVTQDHGANVNTKKPITIKRMFSLPAGSHTFHFMAFNQSGSPSFTNLVMTALAVEE